MNAFTSDQLAGLLIASQLKVPTCDFCHRFATHQYAYSMGDMCCELHKEKLLGMFTTMNHQPDPKDVIEIRRTELSQRLNALVWTNVDEPQQKPTIVMAEQPSTCALYGCEKDGFVRVLLADGGYATLCRSHEPKLT